MTEFVPRDSIARSIWGEPDLVLFVFAGAAAEFALNRAVDWLFFTGAIPRDPIGRLFSTANFAAQIVFAEKHAALRTIEEINAIHRAVEKARGMSIPQWAYRDVMYMLVYYSERGFELLYRPLSKVERDELYDVYRDIAELMHIEDVPSTYEQWQTDRQSHMENDLVCSPFTAKLYTSYRSSLGEWRYRMLLQLQAELVPEYVRGLLKLHEVRITRHLCHMWGAFQGPRLKALFRGLIVPSKHLPALERLDRSRIAS